MSQLEADIPFYEFKTSEKQRAILAKIYKMRVASLESAVYSLNDLNKRSKAMEALIK